MPHIEGWWLLLVAALPAVLWIRKRRPAPPSLPFPTLTPFRGLPRTRRTRWRHAALALRIACIVLLAVAMARPRAGAKSVRRTGRGAAIEIVIDRSSSMGSDYGSTTEFDAAKELASRFIRSRGSDLIGLLAFARYARTVSPLTFDQAGLIRRVSQLDLASGEEDGTSIGAALEVAAARVKAADLGRASRAIVLFTDAGSNWDNRLREAAALIEPWGIRVHVIHIDDGTPPNFGLRYAQKRGYDTATLLRRLAERSGGTYSKTRDAEAMARAGAAIDALEPAELPSVQVAGGADLFAYLVAVGLTLLLLEVCTSALWLRSIP